MVNFAADSIFIPSIKQVNIAISIACGKYGLVQACHGHRDTYFSSVTQMATIPPGRVILKIYIVSIRRPQ